MQTERMRRRGENMKRIPAFGEKVVSSGRGSGGRSCWNLLMKSLGISLQCWMHMDTVC